MMNMAHTSERVSVEDGTQLRLEVFARTDAPGAPVVLCMPAMGVKARYYEAFAKELHREGLHAVTCDLRGHGASTVRASRGTNFGYAEMVERDWRAAVRQVRQRFPDSPLFLLGHSLGGQLSALYTGLAGEDVQGLVLVASCSVYYRGYGTWAGPPVLLFTQFAGLLASAWGYFPGHQLGFGGREARGVMRDWARQARTGRYAPTGSAHDFEALLSRIEHPVLAITVERDAYAPPAAVDNLCAKMPRARLTRWLYTQAEAGARLDHFRWARHGAPMARRIREWVDAALTPRCQTTETPTGSG
jgi:predicted alpha/beta hydrolase